MFMIKYRHYISILSILFEFHCMYSPFHKTLSKSSLQLHWISLRFYEMGVIWASISIEVSKLYLLFIFNFPPFLPVFIVHIRNKDNFLFYHSDLWTIVALVFFPLLKIKTKILVLWNVVPEIGRQLLLLI